jgi:hypothetical protein
MNAPCRKFGVFSTVAPSPLHTHPSPAPLHPPTHPQPQHPTHPPQVRPLEEAYLFPSFFSSLMQPSDFDAKPSVLLLGQYSTGKTTFIKVG